MKSVYFIKELVHSVRARDFLLDIFSTLEADLVYESGQVGQKVDLAFLGFSDRVYSITNDMLDTQPRRVRDDFIGVLSDMDVETTVLSLQLQVCDSIIELD
jgi:hypothetical protein